MEGILINQNEPVLLDKGRIIPISIGSKIILDIINAKIHDLFKNIIVNNKAVILNKIK